MPHCSQILWLDADATPFRSFDFPTSNPRADIVAAHDLNGLNAGIMLVRRSAWVEKTLLTVWNRDEFLHHPWWEQEALRRSVHDGRIRSPHKIRLTYDFPKHFHHIAGCFSTRSASSCRRKILRDIATFRNASCDKIVLSTHEVTSASVAPH